MEEVKRLAFALVMLAAPVALADSKVDEAKQHFKSGTDLYDENNFRGALVEFQRAYELAPSYRILYNIGQVDMELQDYAGALIAYRRYIREGGSDVPPARVGQVKEEIEKLSRRVGQIIVQTAPGAEVLVDDIRVGFAPLPEPATVNTGRHQVTVHVQGHQADSRVVDIAGQQDVTVAIDNDLVAPGGGGGTAPSVPAGPPSRTPMITAWVFTGVFGVAATVTGIIALSESGTLSDLRNSFPTSKSDLDSERSKLTTTAALTDAFAGATLVSAGIAVWLTLSHHHAITSEQMTAGITPTGAFVAGHF